MSKEDRISKAGVHISKEGCTLVRRTAEMG